ncbi:MAG: RluA family pseudouridine synthase [Pontiellaceae bacterium]|jgi:tRNA pseudouridine32 synthase/23S rRNA pseudouridine746 synthase/23S rRNA pseudouridine1911/1915/1917 synthase|nr:RluA family pseudouridine synthase [Pontiellaceae bacterium]
MKTPRKHRPRGLEIFYEDRDLLVVNKEPGLLTMSFHRDELQTAERILTDYLRKGAARSRLRAFVVHRLDRETSGLLLFAKTEAVQQQLKESWTDVEKEYRAVVHGVLKEKSGTLSSYLAEDENQFVYSAGQTQGRWSETAYEVLRENKQFSELKINLLTGRKNQIRVHFADLGHPVVGDTKYGLKGKTFERMALHSRFIAFNHPYSGKRMTFEAPVPEFFARLMNFL